MGKFISDDDMAKMEAAETPKSKAFLSDDDMAKLEASEQPAPEDKHDLVPFLKESASGLWDQAKQAAAGVGHAVMHPVDTAKELGSYAADVATDPSGDIKGLGRAMRSFPGASDMFTDAQADYGVLKGLATGHPVLHADEKQKAQTEQDASDETHAKEHPLTDFVQKNAGFGATASAGVVPQVAAFAADAFKKSLAEGNDPYTAMKDARNVSVMFGALHAAGEGVGAVKNLTESGVGADIKAGAKGAVSGAYQAAKAQPITLGDLGLAQIHPALMATSKAIAGVKGGVEGAEGAFRTSQELRNLAEESKNIAERSPPAAPAEGQAEAAAPLSDPAQPILPQSQPWPGFSKDMSDPDVLAARSLAGGDHNPVNSYIARKAALFGTPQEAYQKFLNMSPEELKAVDNFSKREASEDAAPLFQKVKDTFGSVRKSRMEELKGQARSEFTGGAESSLSAMQKAVRNADELETTKGAVNPIVDAYNILQNGAGADTFGFAPGHHADVGPVGVFDRLQAARSHISDNIDYDAIGMGGKPATRSATPVEKVLMKVRDTLDQELKGGSPSKIESDGLWRASKKLEDRFFKLAEDKNGVHEVSLAKLFGDNDRAVKAQHYIEELRAFSDNPSLPPELKQSVDEFSKHFQIAKNLSDNKRLLQEFLRKTEGPTGPAVNNLNNTLGKNNAMTRAITTPGAHIREKIALPERLPPLYGQTPYAELPEAEQNALLKQASYQREMLLDKQREVTPQMGAKQWTTIREQQNLPPLTEHQQAQASTSKISQHLQNGSLNGSPYEKTLSEAAQRGPQALAVAHYTLSQRDPAYREMIRTLDEGDQ